MLRSVVFSVDYDDTYTVNPVMFQSIIRIIKNHGFEVICCSARKDNLANRVEIKAGLGELAKDVKIFLTDGEPKRTHMQKHGYYDLIWIDDQPDAIVYGF